MRAPCTVTVRLLAEGGDKPAFPSRRGAARRRGGGSRGTGRSWLSKAGVQREGGDWSQHQAGVCAQAAAPLLVSATPSLQPDHSTEPTGSGPHRPAVSGHSPGCTRPGPADPGRDPCAPTRQPLRSPTWNRAEPGGPTAPRGWSWTPTDPLTVSEALRKQLGRPQEAAPRAALPGSAAGETASATPAGLATSLRTLPSPAMPVPGCPPPPGGRRHRGSTGGPRSQRPQSPAGG